MKKDLLCLRCGTTMGFVMRERLQLGHTRIIQLKIYQRSGRSWEFQKTE